MCSSCGWRDPARVIEWYDRCCLKVNRNEGPNILLYKPAIKYMYKETNRLDFQAITHRSRYSRRSRLAVPPFFIFRLGNHGATAMALPSRSTATKSGRRTGVQTLPREQLLVVTLTPISMRSETRGSPRSAE